jgi:hypothetical protein
MLVTMLTMMTIVEMMTRLKRQAHEVDALNAGYATQPPMNITQSTIGWLVFTAHTLFAATAIVMHRLIMFAMIANHKVEFNTI